MQQSFHQDELKRFFRFHEGRFVMKREGNLLCVDERFLNRGIRVRDVKRGDQYRIVCVQTVQ